MIAPPGHPGPRWAAVPPGPLLPAPANAGCGSIQAPRSDTRFTLRALPGAAFSAVQIVCMMRVGIKQIDPSHGSGFDIDREYEPALSLQESPG